MTNDMQLKKLMGAGLAKGLLSMAMCIYMGSAFAQAPVKPHIGGNVFGGGRMADVKQTTAATTATINIYASTIDGGVFGGNDVKGEVQKGSANCATITIHDKCAVDGPSANIAEVYGGGNGYYFYEIAGDNVNVYARNADGTKKDDVILATFDKTSDNIEDYYPILAASVVNINGGSIDKAFAGGNAATVTESAVINVNAPAATEAMMTAEQYNVKELFGGNNLADMNIVPSINLQSGALGTVYGGGNQGDMKGHKGIVYNVEGYANPVVLQPMSSMGINVQNYPDLVGTLVLVDAPAAGLRINTVYGGCKAANVDYSSYVRINNADAINTVYGGCDIAGGVGKMTGLTLTEDLQFSFDDGTASSATVPAGIGFYPASGSSTVRITGGNVTGYVFGGGNGEYTYEADGKVKEVGGSNVIATISAGIDRPWVNSYNVALQGGSVTGTVYGGGNMATVGKPNGDGTYQVTTSYLFLGKTQDVTGGDRNMDYSAATIYAGGRMADVYGPVDVLVKNNMKVGTLFAGNDISGTVQGAGRGDFADTYSDLLSTGLFNYQDANGAQGKYHSYNDTNLKNEGIQVVVRTEPESEIGTLYGGGNGDYDYTSGAYQGLSKPSQKSTWLDIAGKVTTSYGGGNAADIEVSNTYITANATVETAFAGGNSATVTDRANLWLDCDGTRSTVNHINGTETPNVGTIFGGNNIAAMNISPHLQLHRGSVVTVYGGGNKGDMCAAAPVLIDGRDCVSPCVFTGVYPTISNEKIPAFMGTSLVLDSKYGFNADGSENEHDGLFVGTAYAGCKAANVDNSSYIRVSHAEYVGNVYGGCDISGSVGFKPSVLTADHPNMSGTAGSYKLSFDAVAPTKTGDTFTGPARIVPTPIDIPNDQIGKPCWNASAFVLISGGTISGNVFGGGNGDYDYTGELAGLTPPFVAVATTNIAGGTIEGNVYAGGNKAEVGHIITQADIDNADPNYIEGGKYKYINGNYAVGEPMQNMSYLYIGKSSLLGRSDVVINGEVYGGCKMANIYGAVDIVTLKDVNISKLFAGNDISGSVLGNWRGHRFSRDAWNGTSLMGVGDCATGQGITSFSGETLTGTNANVYVRVMPGAVIGELFGGGNGNYDYNSGPYAGMTKPVQECTFIDVAGHVTTAYGGGNAADIGTSNLYIVKNAQVETAFAGGNSATVTREANLVVDCTPTIYQEGQNDVCDDGYIIDEPAHLTSASSLSNAAHNVGTVFGGNNLAEMQIVPGVALRHGKIQTVYGGGNAGNMAGVDAYLLGLKDFINEAMITDWTDLTSDNANNGFQMNRLPTFVSTIVEVDAQNVDATPAAYSGISTSGYKTTDITGLRIDKIYGGCKAADVKYGSYVRLTNADFIGDVYGGCDIAGSVGFGITNTHTAPRDLKSLVYDNVNHKTVLAEDFTFPSEPATGRHYTVKQGTSMRYISTYVTVTDGMVHGNIYGGGNGAYDYTDAAYSAYADNKPWVVGSNVIIEGGTLKGDVYLGGNNATVGKMYAEEYNIPALGGPTHLVAMPSHLMIGKTVRTSTGSGADDIDIDITKNVYCGGRMSDVYTSVDAIVKNGVSVNQFFAGNDISGQITGSMRNRTPGTPLFAYADEIGGTSMSTARMTYSNTTLTDMTGLVYVRVEKDANINTLYGGGNGDYDYSTGPYAGLSKPSLLSSWLDVKGNVGTVYGGGNAADIDYTHICIVGDAHVGTPSVPGAVYGGCKSADVNYISSVVISPFSDRNGTVTNPTVNGNVFGGCDISGNVGATRPGRLDITNPFVQISTAEIQVGDALLPAGGAFSPTSVPQLVTADNKSSFTAANYLRCNPFGMANVIINGGTITGRVFGGGNGLQDAAGNSYGANALSSGSVAGGDDVYAYTSGSYSGKILPRVENTWVTIKNCTIGAASGSGTHTVFGGGQGAGTRVIHNVDVQVGTLTDNTTIKGINYGGSYAGFVNTNCDDHTRTTILGNGANTQMLGDIYGGSYGNYVRGKIMLNINNVLIGEDDAVQGVYVGNNNAGQPECDASLDFAGNNCNVAIYGGGNRAEFCGTTRITFTHGNVGYIYGGGNNADVYGNTIVEVLGGHVCHDVFGGGNNGAVRVNKASDTARNKYREDYGGNTLVIVRNDCLDITDAAFDNTKEYAVSRNTSQAYRIQGAVDPDALAKQWYELKTTEGTNAGKLSDIQIDGNVYGGGNAADVEGKTTVIIGTEEQP